MSDAFTIVEIADQYGVSLRTLRFYEERGLLKPTRVGTRRFYGAKDRVRLELILKGKRLGFTLLELERLLDETLAADAIVEDARKPKVLRLDKARVGVQLELLEKKRIILDGAIDELKKALKARA